MTRTVESTLPQSPVSPATPEMLELHRERIVIEKVTPQLDGGRYPIKREVGEVLEVAADIFRDGHDVLNAVIKYRPSGEVSWAEAALECVNPGLDHWVGRFPLEKVATYGYTIEAWTDTFESWRRELKKKADADQDVASELLEGLRQIETASRRATEPDRLALLQTARAIQSNKVQANAVCAALDPELRRLMRLHQPRAHATTYATELEVVVDRERARFAAWYEFFPRSQVIPPRSSSSESGGKGATFRDCIRRLPDLARMGFDVLYLPPIHPIGRTHRKGKNNRLSAGPNDPGSPWAIGNEHGGHKSIEPALGTLEDFDAFVESARQHSIEIALDFAIHCAPDHPYVKDHPEWFYHRPDGTIKYAENPPKKYQDIYPLNFDTDAWPSLWQEMKSIILFWVGHGVKAFRVDNPHTKPVRFWEWLIGEVKREHPDVVFLSEAFTQPRMMQALAKSGFTQSYTYFTWRNDKAGLIEYLTELTQTEMAEYFRGNLFANTPDILHEYLQKGGAPAFRVRLLLAATLSPLYGIYSGFELAENVPLHAGSEEYLNSEKYEVKARDWDAPGNLKDLIAQVNQVRRDNPALHQYKNLRFHGSDNGQLLCYSKATADLANVVLVVVNLDPHQIQEGYVYLHLEQLGVAPGQRFQVQDQLSGAAYVWQGPHNYIRLDPNKDSGHLFVIHK